MISKLIKGQNIYLTNYFQSFNVIFYLFLEISIGNIYLLEFYKFFIFIYCNVYNEYLHIYGNFYSENAVNVCI